MTADPAPFGDQKVHEVGELILSVGNSGTWGNDVFIIDSARQITNVIGGSEYPKGSNLQLLNHVNLWIGATINGDTSVSTAFSYWPLTIEFSPDAFPDGQMIHRTIAPGLSQSVYDAVSEEDWVAEYTDTFSVYYPWVGYDYLTLRPHRPLNVKVRQESFAWSYKYAEDFVLFRFRIKNIGRDVLKQAFVGFEHYPWVGFRYGGRPTGGTITGFLQEFHTADSKAWCAYPDTVNIAWAADNDGDPLNGYWQNIPVQVGDYIIKSNRNIVGATVLNSSRLQTSYGNSDARLSYNWWSTWGVQDTVDFGPRLHADTRDYHTGYFGWPMGDRNLYYIMQNGEIDYPSSYTASISQYDLVWKYPNQAIAPGIADGRTLEFLLSVGPFDLYPGEEMEIPYAIVAGENFHLYPNNGDNLPYNPEQWMKNVDFSDLAKNALWAQWVYDNPGVDTDGDGYRGEYHVCVTDSALDGGNWTVAKAETTYYRGDGVPDWKGAHPPPAPKVWVEPVLNGIRVRWNGSRSETEKDPFLQAVDFEGYHVYFGRDNREASMQLIANYDRQNYDKHTFIPIPNDSGLWESSWEVQNIPFTLEQLRCLYGNSCYDSSFDPENYTTSSPYRNPSVPDSIFYFTKHDYNTSRLGIDTDVRKVYPDARDPSTVHPDSLTPDDYTPDSLLKFYEYELIIPNLLPSVNYFASVTAYDFGSPPSGLQALESPKMADIHQVYPYINPGDEDEASRKVYIYPNPYRSDAAYRADGLESRGRDEDFVDRVRQVHFNNLPHKCTIRIFTLDG
ncbi:MAG: hypothetical protein AAB305_00625, partial [Candidatus Zixiibacteriota bacterium]